MTSDIDSNRDSDSQDPYSLLGLKPGAGFDEVQKARAKRLVEVGDNAQAKAKIEASYDAVLMNSLKARQLGKVSNAAINASQREDGKIESASGLTGASQSLLTKLSRFSTKGSSSDSQSGFPGIALPEGSGLTVRLIAGLFAFLLLVLSPVESVELILALSTIGLFVSQIKRGIRPLQSLGWSVVSLSIGLIIGGFFASNFGPQISESTSLLNDQIQALPAILIIWTCSLLLA